MKGIGILTHAIGMLAANFGPALRLSALLMAVQFALVLGLDLQGLYLPVDPFTAEPVAGAAPEPALGGALVLWIVQILTGIWIAVGWHRFILCEEVPQSVVPTLHPGALLRYFGVGLLYSLILLVAAIPLTVAAFFVVGPAALAGQSAWGLGPMLVFAALVWLPLAYLGLRLAPILPAAALQRRLPLKEAWYQTGASGWDLAILAIVSALAYLLVSMPVLLLAMPAPFLAFLWAFLVQWAALLLGASLLTTIYGHYIEDRPLNA